MRLKLIMIAIVVILGIYIYEKGTKSIKDSRIWYSRLPSCPCYNPDINGIKINDGWAKDIGNIGKYHKGAKESFRSYPAISTNAGESCQQCCYDENGKLITEGSGAGTPDMVSTCDGEDSKGKMTVKYVAIIFHYYKDVMPWEKYGGVDSGWKQYNKTWVPNKGDRCN